ncbi:MAG: YfiM family protein [Saprospiraceae bacterium]|nr:YfiM family protein [Saprospiraceae bacterium]
MKKIFWILIFFYYSQNDVQSQSDSLELTFKTQFLDVVPSFNKSRFWVLTSVGFIGYTGVTIGFNQAWYTNYKRSEFHFFDDWNGWRQMDKFGHAMTGYFESKWAGDLYRWTGIPRKHSCWIGFGTGMLFQTTLEVLDGFSEKWGFSWGDMAFNLIGGGLYLGQELLWNEQRIRLKMSIHKPQYSEAPIQSSNSSSTTSINERAASLFGTSAPELLFKEYNGQTIWLSINVASFCKTRKNNFPPSWINVALGYGIENVFGAESNTWEDDNGNIFSIPQSYERHSQFYLSLDIDFERIPTKHKWLKVVFSILNIFKVPFPTLEVNTLGQVKFHPFYF